MMNENLRIGWYFVTDENFNADGSISMTVKDVRNGYVVNIELADLESQSVAVDYLSNNQVMGTLESFAA